MCLHTHTISPTHILNLSESISVSVALQCPSVHIHLDLPSL